MADDMTFLSTGSIVTTLVILGNLIFFLGLPMLVAFYMKKRLSEKTVSQEANSQ